MHRITFHHLLYLLPTEEIYIIKIFTTIRAHIAHSFPICYKASNTTITRHNSMSYVWAVFLKDTSTLSRGQLYTIHEITSRITSSNISRLLRRCAPISKLRMTSLSGSLITTYCLLFCSPLWAIQGQCHRPSCLVQLFRTQLHGTELIWVCHIVSRRI